MNNINILTLKMSSKKLFGDRTLYEILGLDIDARITDVKKKYYKLALIHHPDRVDTHKKKEANDEFHIIHQAYSILSNPENKRAYDDGLDVFFTKATISAHWESHLKIVDNNSFAQAKNDYQGSDKEKEDIIREFKGGNGSITHLLNSIPFMRVEDENRVTNLIKQLIGDGILPALKIKKIPKKY